MGKNQREYVLRQQLKAIKEELGEDDGDQGDLDGLRGPHRQGQPPHRGREVAKKQLKRLRTMQVGSAEYTVVRTYLDWILDLPWTHSPRQPRHRQGARGPRRGSLRPREGQEAHPRVPRGAQAQAGQEGSHPLPARAARRGQDLARALHRARARAEVCPHLARRRARRGRHPRSPPHLRRRAARPDHPGHEEGGHGQPGVHARRDRQDRARLPRRPLGGAARGARPGAEQHLRRPLPRDPVRPVGGDVRRDRQRRRPHPPPLRDRMEILEIPGYTRNEKLAIARSTSCRSSSTSTASRSRSSKSPTTPSRRSSTSTRARPASAPRAPGGGGHPRRRREDRRGRGGSASTTPTTCTSSSAPRSTRARWPSAPKRRASPRASRGRRWAARSSSSRRRG
jgi:ATP-dependent Lon protease